MSWLMVVMPTAVVSDVYAFSFLHHSLHPVAVYTRRYSCS